MIRCNVVLDISLIYLISANAHSNPTEPLGRETLHGKTSTAIEHVWVQQLYSIMSGKLGVEF